MRAGEGDGADRRLERRADKRLLQRLAGSRGGFGCLAGNQGRRQRWQDITFRLGAFGA